MANGAWLALTVMAHNLGRAVGRLAGHDLEKATPAILQRRVLTVPGRNASGEQYVDNLLTASEPPDGYAWE